MKIKIPTTPVVIEQEIEIDLPIYRKSKYGYSIIKVTEHGFVKIYSDSLYFQPINSTSYQIEFNSMYNDSNECTETEYIEKLNIFRESMEKHV